MSLPIRRPPNQELGHGRHSRAGMVIGAVQGSPNGLSWLAEEQTWEPRSREFIGGLSIDPVTFERLMKFLVSHSHTGMGHATPALARDTDGLNALAREAAHVQANDEVIGPRHPLFTLDGV